MGETVESGVLELKLTNTPSFEKLWDMEIKKQQQERLCPCETSVDKASNKTKARNIQFASLRIGNWRWDSCNEGDSIAKLYFAKRRVLWEVLAGELKNKVEIPWDDITAIRFVSNSQHDTLEIQLGKRPLFFKETTPLPKTHGNWELQSDFTGGEATKCRIHHVRFNPGDFKNPYQQLLKSDKKLFELSQKPFPTDESPYFPNFVVVVPQLPPPPPPLPPFEYHYPYSIFYPTSNPPSMSTANGINISQFVMDQALPCHLNGPMITDTFCYGTANTSERTMTKMMPSSSTSRAVTLGCSNDFDSGPNRFADTGIGSLQHEDYYQTSGIVQSFQSQPAKLPPYPESNISPDGFQTRPMNLANFSETNGGMEIEVDNLIHNSYVVRDINNPYQYRSFPHDRTK